MKEKVGTAVVTGALEGAGEVTITLGEKSSKKAVTVTAKQ